MADASFEYLSLEYSGIKIYDQETARLNGILRNAMVTSAGVSYGLSDHFTMAFHLPYVRIQSVYMNEGNSALADANLTAAYSFSLNERGSFGATLIGGIKLPTGQPMQMNSVTLALSTGSFGPLAGAAVSFVSKQLSAVAQLNYWYNTEGSNGVRQGDVFVHETDFRYILTENKPAKDSTCGSGKHNPTLQAEAGLRGERLMPATLYGEKMQNTGSYLLYLHTGIKTQMNRHLCIPMSVSFLVFEDEEGFQNVSHLRVDLSLQYLF